MVDIGCGNGWLACELGNKGFEVVGIDADAKGVAIATGRGGGASFLHASCYEDPGTLALSNFDAAICLEVLEHLYQPSAALRFARSALREKGVFLCSTPYHGYWKNLVISLLNRWDQHWNPLRDGGHIKFFSKMTLRRLLESNGFSAVCIQAYGRMPGLWKTMMAVSIAT